MRAALPAVLTAAAALAACTATAPPRAAAVPPPAPGIASAAAPLNCVPLNRIREARVIDDQTIDFIQTGGQILRNTLPYKCSQLGFEKAFTYATSLSQLCSVDIITVIVQGGGVRTGASCGLGKFVPYTPIPKAPK